MNRRDFLGAAKDIGLAAAVGVPLLGSAVVDGDIVDVVFRSETDYGLHDFRLFIDRASDRLGLREKDGDRMQVPLRAALRAIEGCLVDVRLESISACDGRRHFGDPAILFADRTANEFGIASPGKGSERATVPLSGVLQLLKKAEVL